MYRSRAVKGLQQTFSEGPLSASTRPVEQNVGEIVAGGQLGENLNGVFVEGLGVGQI